MTLIYCVQCKQEIDTSNPETVKTINNKVWIKGNWVISEYKKLQFISNKSRSGFLNDPIAKAGDLGIELHLPADEDEYVPNGSFNDWNTYSYAGPGTQYLKQVKKGNQNFIIKFLDISRYKI